MLADSLHRLFSHWPGRCCAAHTVGEALEMAASKIDLPAAAAQWLELKAGKTVVDHKRTLEEVCVFLTVICVCLAVGPLSVFLVCYDQIKGNQELKTCSHTNYLILSLSLFLTVVCVCSSPSAVVCVSLFLTNEHWRR